ncbi:DinB family protein [candidate division KSB1 bacterium]|nr:DinB family protein [candidate division KSB1 bacterium]NIR73458.1 DinB family protein [candidate division KSB1 bacterium]NIS27073.1 DinB family protein [candidate division KSB1 bacterium]NIT73917.1 DinB family protein [candidate division KSB1 bacterium]NIU27818.1 DinB family protein [candidate division KSB1 bacterium]
MEIQSVKQFLDYFERIYQRTFRVVQCIPRDKIEWTYKEGKFTFGDLVRHLAALERYMFAENFKLKPSRYPGHGKGLADGYENVLAFLEKMHQDTVAMIRELSDSDLGKKCVTPNGTAITVWKWMRAMIEHHVHHRGQIYLYLSMLGIQTPPLYGLTSEEVYDKSEG